jgi:H+-transporting ATPase
MSNKESDIDVDEEEDDEEDDEEEAQDEMPDELPPTNKPRVKMLSDLEGMSVEKVRRHEKMVSDLTGMTPEHVRTRVARGDRRTVSDLVLLLNLPEETATATSVRGRTQRMRQGSAADILQKFGYVPNLRNDDLKLAEEVIAFGTESERTTQGISKEDHGKVFAEEDDGFVFTHEGLSSEDAAARLAKYGRNELPEFVDPKWLIFLRQFWAPMPIMIWLAIIIEAAISNFLDMGILLGIQFINAFISFYETTKAGDAVAALKSSLKPIATCKRDGKWQNIDGATIVPGDLVLLASGSAIPADCRINSSEIDVDQAALTGESLPVTFFKGNSCKMGSTVVRGEVEATVEFTGADTFFGKTASLLEDHHESSHLQSILLTIMFVLVSLSLVMCAINMIYLVAKGVDVEEALGFTIVLLVASIPLAIEIVTTTTLAIGSKNLAKHGAIVSKLAAIEVLAGMSILCSDKTGTLTLNQMVLQEDTPIYAAGENQESVLVMAALAAKWKEPPRDALDRLTLGGVNMSLLEPYEQIDFLPFDPQIKRTQGTIKDTRNGTEFKTSKGAPHVMLGLLEDDDFEVREAVERDVARLGACGIRSLAVARYDTDSGKWKMQGLLTFLDPPRPDTKQTIKDANKYGIQVKMITGDHLLIAVNTAMQLGMGDKIFTSERLPLLDPETKQKPADLSKTYGDICLAANGFAQVFPEHKYLIVECLRELGYIVGMTGDGVNDAPALKRADIGVAVAGATDAARAAADIILTHEGLGTIIHGIVIAREIFSRISNFIIYRIAATLQLLFFFFIAVIAFHPSDYQQPPDDILDNGLDWPDFFHMPVLMLMLITLLNDGTLITIAYDYAEASPTPNKWNLKVLFAISTVLGSVSCFSSLILLYFLLDSWNENGLLQSLGMEGVQYGQIITAIYLKVSVSDFLTLFSARTGSRFFWKVPPAPILLAGGCFALTLSSLLSIFWPNGELDGIQVEGLQSNMGLFAFVWLFSLVFWGFQDVLKVLTYKWMHKANFYGINETGVMVMPESALKLIEEFDAAMKEASNEEDEHEASMKEASGEGEEHA